MTALKADQQAAERLLKKAVKRAAADLQTDLRPVVESHLGEGTFLWRRRSDAEVAAVRRNVVAMLTAAGESAALLLGETP
jgi:hypothetical protein